MSRPAVFLDRDGVLIRDVHLLTECHQVELYPCAPEAVRRLRASGFCVVVITNQPVVARGLSSEQNVEAVHACIQQMLNGSGGGEIDRFYFCPHHPKADVAEYRVRCECRKPKPGMLVQAARDLDLDLAASYMVGDRPSDIAAGQRAGCRTILVETGMHTAVPIESEDMPQTPVAADHVCSGLGAAADFILPEKA